MKKKLFLSLICGVLVLGVATGCGRNNNSTSNNSGLNNGIDNTQNQQSTSSDITIESVKNAKETNFALFSYVDVDGGISITDYTGTDEIVVIPEVIDGKTVVSIGRNAFVNNDTIKGLKIANTVHTIEYGACLNCTELKVLVSGTSLKTINDYAFSSTKLEYVELNNGLETLEISCFGFTYLKQIEIPSSVVNINLPLLVDEVNNNGTITVIGEVGSAAERYVQEKGQEYHLTFQAK